MSANYEEGQSTLCFLTRLKKERDFSMFKDGRENKEDRRERPWLRAIGSRLV